MGTRHLTVVKLDGEYKVAQYGQWDGYPQGQGKTILSFLKRFSMRKFKDKVRAASFMDQKEIEKIWRDGGADERGSISFDDADKVKLTYPQISRDMGGDILEWIHKQPAGVKLQNTLDFAGDSIFCEYTYVIDFDKNTFEVYKGFNKEPLTENDRFFCFMDQTQTSAYNKETYYPIKLKASYSLDDLPSQKEMENDVDPVEEDEEVEA